MSTFALRGRPWTKRPPVSRPDAAFAVAVPLLAIVVGVGVASGRTQPLVLATAATAFALAGLRNWRASLLGLLAFIPFSGLLIIAAYPEESGPATLAKDIFFVVPAYLGFAAAFLLRRRAFVPVGFPLGVAIVFAGIVCAQTLNPTLPSFLVGLVGTKVWLMYIPMAFLGYHFVRSKEDLRHLLVLMTAVAVVPLLIGVVEGVLVNTGRGATVYAFYGDAAGAVTQEFGEFGGETANIRRVSSTFSFVAQYWVFTVAMTAVTYAYWRGFLSRESREGPIVGAALFGLTVLASSLSGARGAILTAPALLLVITLLDGSLRRVSVVPLAALISGGLITAATVFGTNLTTLIDNVLAHGVYEFTLNTVEGFSNAIGRTTFGLGTGVDTVPARYALPESDPFELVGGRAEESWWVKALLELGVVGLVVVVVLVVTVLARTFAAQRRLRDDTLRTVSAALFGFILFTAFYNFKGSYMDIDPGNVLFWLFAGILLKLPRLEADHAPVRASPHEP